MNYPNLILAYRHLLSVVLFSTERRLTDANRAQLADPNMSEVSKLLVMLKCDATVADPTGLLVLRSFPRRY
jgi:hypothetical protein